MRSAYTGLRSHLPMEHSAVEGLQRHFGCAVIQVLNETIACAEPGELVLDDFYFSHGAQGREDLLRHIRLCEPVGSQVRS